MSSSSAYYSNEEAVIRRETEVEQSSLTRTPPEQLEEVYEIERCTDYIRTQKCKRVALQFPDSLLTDASSVAWQLEKNCDAKIYVLADTSYGHCDVDEVNAKHVTADLIIHYGESALTQSATIPTLFVFGRPHSSVDSDKVCEVFYQTFSRKDETRVVFLHHVTCDYVAEQISSKLLPEYPYLSVGQLNIPKDPGGAKGQNEKEGGADNILKDLCTNSCPGCPCRLKNGAKEDSKTEKPSPMDGIELPDKLITTESKISDKMNTETSDSLNSNDISRSSEKKDNSSATETSTDLPNGSSNVTSNMEVDNTHQPDCKDYVTGFYTIPLEIEKELSDYSIFYLGPKNAESLRNLMLSHPSCDVHVYDPESGYEKLQSNTNRQLMKRYYLVEKAKDAKIVGILVGTMGVAGYLECLEYMKKIGKAAGKKTYTFIMGKLTPEKLANFLEIDIYVLVANPEHSILDRHNFYRPVITPYEFDIACNPNREWSENYITDFRRILPGGRDFVKLPAVHEPSIEETTVSLITGNIRSNIDIEDNIAFTTSDSVAIRNEDTDVAVFGTNSSAHQLSQRTWKGLEQKIGETPIVKAKEGRSGIPVSYNEMTDF